MCNRILFASFRFDECTLCEQPARFWLGVQNLNRVTAMFFVREYRACEVHQQWLMNKYKIYTKDTE